MESQISERSAPTPAPDVSEEAHVYDDQFGATRGNAFGLEIRSSFPVHGLLGEDRGVPTSDAQVRLDLGSADEIDAAVLGREGSRLREWPGADGQTEQWIDRYGDAGFRLVSLIYGSYLISADGSHVVCAPSPSQPLWQRMLVGQLLTHVAVLRGIELFHASAVAIGGAAIGIVGFSHTGKTSLALRLTLGGASFIADDVIAIDPTNRSITAHRGVGVCNLRHSEAELLSPTDRARLGRVIGEDADCLRLVIAPKLVARARESSPLRSLYFPRRGGSGDRPVFRRIARPDPVLLLANTFGLSLRMPERLHRQLDLCARVAREIPIFDVQVPASVGAATLADQIERHVGELIEEEREG